MKIKKIERPEFGIEYGNLISLFYVLARLPKVAIRKIKINVICYDEKYGERKLGERTIYVIPKFRFKRCNDVKE